MTELFVAEPKNGGGYLSVLGILFTVLLLLLFRLCLHAWRQTVVAALAVPTSMASAALLVQAAGCVPPLARALVTG